MNKISATNSTDYNNRDENWSTQEDATLHSLLYKKQFPDWLLVAANCNNKTIEQCQRRWEILSDHNYQMDTPKHTQKTSTSQPISFDDPVELEQLAEAACMILSGHNYQMDTSKHTQKTSTSQPSSFDDPVKLKQLEEAAKLKQIILNMENGFRLPTPFPYPAPYKNATRTPVSAQIDEINSDGLMFTGFN